jgi:hypothetical protein
MKQQAYVIFLFLIAVNSFAQSDSISVLELKASESFWNLTDTNIRNEIAHFNRKGDSIKQRASVKQVELIEIPLISCSDTVINFHLKSSYIHLYFAPFDTSGHQFTYSDNDSLILIDHQPFWGTYGELPTRKVRDVFFVLHSHLLVDFPPEAFTGIYQPPWCMWDYNPVGKIVHRESLATPNLRLFHSTKTNHHYLYLLNGEGENRYEVTWIVEGGSYLRRVVDEGI